MVAAIRHSGRRVALWAIAGLGVLLSGAAFMLARSYDDARVRALFDQRADWEMHVLDRRIRAMLEPLAPLALFFGREQQASAELLEQFGLQARSFDIPVRRLSWSPRVTAAEKDRFVTARRAAGQSDYEIRELVAANRFGPAAPRPEYFPIVHEVVFDDTPTAMGFDVASDPDRRGAVERARERAVGTAAVAPPSTGGLTSMVVRWPVFEGGSLPTSVDERRQRLWGFVNAVFDPVEMLQGALGDRKGVVLPYSVRAGRHQVGHWEAAAGQLRAGPPAADATPPPGMLLQRDIIVYGMPLGLNLVVPAAAVAEEHSLAPWLVLALGLVLTGGVVRSLGRAEGALDRAIAVQSAVREALDRSEERFRDFAEAASDWLWEIDDKLEVTWVSDAATGKRGADIGPVMGRRFIDFGLPGPDEADWTELMRATRARERFQNLVVARVDPDGETRYVRVSGKPLFDAGGGFLGYRGSASSATEEYAARAQMRLARERLQDAIESLPCGFLLFDAQERLVAANAWTRGVLARLGLEETAAAARLHGALGMRGLVKGVPEDKAAWCAARLARFRSGDHDEEEEWSDGRWYQVIQRRTANGNAVVLYFDITDRRQAETRLRQSQRMEAMGQLTGGIAHDFNNLLLVIIVSLDLLRDVPDLEPPFPSLLDNAHAAATRAADLTRRLLAFARHQPLQSTVIDIGALVEGMHGLLTRTLGPTIRIELSLPIDLWLVANDQSQIENALLNLAINARDAMPRGGTLRIACFNHAGPPEEGLAAGDYVALSVQDDGVGMDADVARRAFDPFFTTKPVGKGTGLGLSMIYGFARQSGGHVTLTSAPGEGTTVTLYLPRCESGSVAPMEAEIGAAESGHEMILVVEDDADVRATAVQLIEQLGYSVLEAADGPTALKLLADHPEIALMFTDVVMPGGMRGDELAKAALGLRPGLKILMSSGNVDFGTEPGAQETTAYNFIAKPYRAQALAQRLREALG